MLELMIGAASFFCGFALMFAIHRVMFDYYDEDAKAEIHKLNQKISDLQYRNIQLNTQLSHKDQDSSIVVEHMIHHTFATPADVADLKFLED